MQQPRQSARLAAAVAAMKARKAAGVDISLPALNTNRGDYKAL